MRLEEGGIEARFSEDIVVLSVRKHRRWERPPATGFVNELPKKRLKSSPILLGFDERGRFVELTILKPQQTA